jgi:hypothetical protein
MSLSSRSPIITASDAAHPACRSAAVPQSKIEYSRVRLFQADFCGCYTFDQRLGFDADIFCRLQVGGFYGDRSSTSDAFRPRADA